MSISTSPSDHFIGKLQANVKVVLFCDPMHIINWVVQAQNADWLAAVVYLCNKARGGVVYGQYTAATVCIQTLRVVSCIRTALSRGILAICHTPSGLIA